LTNAVEDGRTEKLLAVSRDVTVAHQAGIELRESEARYRSLVTATSAIVWNGPASGQFETEQPAWAAFTGQTFDEYKGWGWVGAIHPDDKPRTVSAWEAALEKKALYQVEHRLRRLDGEYRHMHVKGVPITNAEGEVHEWVGVHTDITTNIEGSLERERLLKEVQAANQRMADVFHKAPAFMCVLQGPDHVFEMVNEHYQQLVGHRDLLGQPARQALPEVEGQGLFELLDQVFQTGEPFVGMDLPIQLQRSSNARLEERFVDFVFMALRDADKVISGILVHGVDQTSRKLAEIAEQDNKKRLLLATETAEIGFWSWDTVDDKVVWENLRPFEIFGLSPADESINGARFVTQFVHPDDAEGFNRALSRTIETGERFFFQGRIRHVDGSHRWVEFVGRSQAGKGSSRQIIGTVIDVTNRKLAEIELFESRERFQKIVSQASTGVVQSDTDGRITLVNQRYCDMLGYAEGDLLGKSVFDVTPPDSMQGTINALNKVIDGQSGVVIEKQYRRKDGSLMWATSSVNALRGPDGKYQGIVAIVVDITERRRTEEKLRASEERYRTLFESMDQGFCIIEIIFDAAGAPFDYRFIEVNPVFETQTGLLDVAGKTVRELVPDIDALWVETYGQVALTGEPVRLEREVKAWRRWFDVHATRIGGEGSKRVALLFNDVTERKRTDANLRRLAADLSEADRRKTEFLATLAHELRNPLAPIRSGLGVMRLSGDNPAAIAKIRDMMDRQITYMVRLIDDLLDVARISGGKMELKRETTELKNILSSAVETSLPLIEASHHDLVVDVPEEPLLVNVDVTRIAQVIANLLNNAAKYTPPRGHIRLSVQRGGNQAVITVTDSGVGIPPESLTDVFEMFSQVGRNMDRAQGGLGIGLSLVRRLAEMHEGSVVVASEGPGKGSTFTLRLPLISSNAETHEFLPGSFGRKDDRAAQSLRILVVDDNADAADMLSTILAMDGHITRVANNGIQGLNAAREFRPVVAFLDIGMPGMNGYEVAQALKKMPETNGIALVALTGWGAASDRERSKSAGFDHHLTKPVDLATVTNLVSQLATLAAHAYTQSVDVTSEDGNAPPSASTENKTRTTTTNLMK
jgi:PAS domain S-box-containing protein